MDYVMSDIHGCYDKYLKMLEKIEFSLDDTLYVLGDVLDRGPAGIKTLLDLSARENVVLLRGNHDHQAGILLANLHMLDNEGCPSELVELYGVWLSDGGKNTLAEYLKLTDEEQNTVINAIKKMKKSVEITVGGKQYLLAHTVPGVERSAEYKNWTLEECIMGEPDYERCYFKDMYVVTGHTPTGFIDRQSVGQIWQGNNHIVIDCGAVFGKPLGCLCLNTMEEFYVF